MTTQKAKRATITLGDIELDVFQLPNGDYLLSQSEILEAIGLNKNWISRLQKSTPKQLEELQSLGFTGYSELIKVDKTRAKGITLVEASLIWTYHITKGNLKALALVVASSTESIERRADTAFSIIRTEEQRNDRFKARVDGILSRHFWTDCIKWYCDENEKSDTYRTFVYSRVSDKVNKAFFGLSAKQIREYFDMHKSEHVRDYIPQHSLRSIDHVETYAGQLVKTQDYRPEEAIREALEFWNIQITSLDN